jgi:hypothetical protein
MAIAAGSIVAPKTSGIGLNPSTGPLFGIVQSGAGPFAVLWFNGVADASVVALALDEILVASGSTAATFVGRRVKVNSPAGQNNWAYMVCVGAYNRNGSDTLLLQNPTGEYFVEALSANCSALPN